MGIGALGTSPYDNPMYFGGCYWDEATSPAKDPADVGGGETSEDVLGEIVMPTNSTATDALFGDSNPFNSITSFTEASAKTLETIKKFLGGTYILDVIGNITIGCDLVPDVNDVDSDGNTTELITQKKPTCAQDMIDTGTKDNCNEVWEYLVEGISYAIMFSAIIVIVSIVRGIAITRFM